MKKSISFLIVFLIVSSSMINTSAEPYMKNVEGDSKTRYFEDIFTLAMQNNGIKASLKGTSGNDIFKGIDQALAMLSAVNLYDIYGTIDYLNKALAISDFASTFLTDPSEILVASFYEDGNDFVSNQRNMEDNLMLMWGFTELSKRLNDTLLIQKQDNRAEFLAKDIHNFIDGDLFLPSFRVDNKISANIFNAYHNLFSAYIITEDPVRFADLLPNAINVFEFVKANMTSENGGIHTIYARGFHDNLVSLKNTAIYSLLALKLFEITGTQQYFDDATAAIDYILAYCLDIGLTGGYFEIFIDDKPIQKSKSLSSHAFLLLAFQKLVALGNESARIDLLSLWQTIMAYFRTGKIFESTISRDGTQGSNHIATFDNLLLIYALSQMPLISRIDFLSEIEFSDTAVVNITYSASENTEFNLTLYFWKGSEDPQKISQIITGTGSLETISLEFTPVRPDSDVVDNEMLVVLRSETIITDFVQSAFLVIKDTGLVLSTQTVTLFSVLLIIVFVYFLRSLQKKTGEAKE
ncbi:MAG: hypothetical protein GPJ54_10035 [Candidatus Heimdallarchaeota archaeon]|nr:hypothetical protein [Candidatus Heimdallarchaeota archaeon]